MKCTRACVGGMCILCYVFVIPRWRYIAHYLCVCCQAEEDVDESIRHGRMEHSQTDVFSVMLGEFNAVLK